MAQQCNSTKGFAFEPKYHTREEVSNNFQQIKVVPNHNSRASGSIIQGRLLVED
jgi:hypothetical protein